MEVDKESVQPQHAVGFEKHLPQRHSVKKQVSVADELAGDRGRLRNKELSDRPNGSTLSFTYGSSLRSSV